MIRPFLKDLTKSELHAVCTGGFASIAGAVMAAYILMKVWFSLNEATNARQHFNNVDST